MKKRIFVYGIASILLLASCNVNVVNDESLESLSPETSSSSSESEPDSEQKLEQDLENLHIDDITIDRALPTERKNAVLSIVCDNFTGLKEINYAHSDMRLEPLHDESETHKRYYTHAFFTDGSKITMTEENIYGAGGKETKDIYSSSAEDFYNGETNVFILNEQYGGVTTYCEYYKTAFSSIFDAITDINDEIDEIEYSDGLLSVLSSIAEIGYTKDGELTAAYFNQDFATTDGVISDIYQAWCRCYFDEVANLDYRLTRVEIVSSKKTKAVSYLSSLLPIDEAETVLYKTIVDFKYGERTSGFAAAEAALPDKYTEHVDLVLNRYQPTYDSDGNVVSIGSRVDYNYMSGDSMVDTVKHSVSNEGYMYMEFDAGDAFTLDYEAAGGLLGETNYVSYNADGQIDLTGKVDEDWLEMVEVSGTKYWIVKKDCTIVITASIDAEFKGLDQSDNPLFDVHYEISSIRHLG